MAAELRENLRTRAAQASVVMRALRRSHLRPGNVARTAPALPAVAAVDLLVRILGFRRTRVLVGRLVPLRRRRGFSTTTTEEHAGLAATFERRTAGFVQALDRAGSLIRPGEMCLRRSLALWAWLRWHGVESSIQLGVRRTANGLTGHAWVEHQGMALFESTEVIHAQVSFGSLEGGHTHRGEPPP